MWLLIIVAVVALLSLRLPYTYTANQVFEISLACLSKKDLIRLLFLPAAVAVP